MAKQEEENDINIWSYIADKIDLLIKKLKAFNAEPEKKNGFVA